MDFTRIQQLSAKQCSCGQFHTLATETIHLGAGVISRLPAYITDRYGSGRCIAVYDTNTVSAADISGERIVLPAGHLHADETGTGLLREALDKKDQITVLIAVGSGTVHDVVRYIAAERGYPFISVPTAASVDGFLSGIAAMTLGGRKVTTPAVPPVAVFADTNIFANAPDRLTASGAGDLLGKYTSLCDWEISHASAGEHMCRTVYDLQREALDTLVDVLPSRQTNPARYCEVLMYGLLLSGLAIQLIGNSRPASGAEHHLSHLWEMEVINKELDALHGEKVGVGTVEVSRRYHQLAACNSAELMPYTPIDRQYICKNYGVLANGIIDENANDTLARLYADLDYLNTVRQIVRKVPAPEKLTELLELAGGKISLEDIGLDQSYLAPSLELAPYVRARMTLLRMAKRVRFL